MPGFNGHLFGGVATGAIVSYVTFEQYPHVWPIFVGASIFGSLFPDSDTASTSRKYIYWIFFLGSCALIYTGQLIMSALLGVLSMLPNLGPHRGWTHTYLGALVVSIIGFIVLGFFSLHQDFNLLVACSFLIGYLSHLVLDRV